MSESRAADARPGQHRIFRFGKASLDEGSLELRVDGVLRELGAKPRALLMALLAQPNIVLTTEEILATVWPGVLVGDGSVPTAINSLRKALGDEKDAITTVSKVGYKIVGPVVVSLVETAVDPRVPLQAGGKVPGRPQWRLHRRLGFVATSDVWVARHDITSETRVFKFGGTPARLDSLKREAALSRLLNTKLGARPDIIPVSDCNFSEQPYFIESRYGGPDLSTWLENVGGAAASAVATRVAMVAQVARTVADAHDAGVIHGDIKPLNILIEDVGGGAVRTRLIDFGVGGLTPAARAELLTATFDGLGDSGARGKAGTFLYMAPEIRRGAPPTVAGDIYALGILLYQMVVGDLDRPLAADWEGDIGDPLLRQDIAAAAAGGPERRLDSAKELMRRLETLDSRRAEADALAEQSRLRMLQDAEHEQLVQTAELRRVEAASAAEREAHAVALARRTRLAASILLVMLGGASALALYAHQEQRRATTEADRANGITTIAEETVSSLIDDISQGLQARPVLTGADLQKLLDRAQATISKMSSLAPESLQLRRLEARLLVKFADLRSHQSDSAGALEAATRAVSLQTTLLTAYPSNAELQTELSYSERWVGAVKMKQRDLPGAMAAYQRSLDILKRLAGSGAADSALKLKLARAYEAVGNVLLEQNDAKGAFVPYRIAYGIIAAEASENIVNLEWQRERSIVDEKIGDTLAVSGDDRGSLAAYSSDLQIRQNLCKLQPYNMSWQRDLSVAYADVGDEQTKLADADSGDKQRRLADLHAALASYKAASALDRERLPHDPDSAQWKSDVALSNQEVADTLVALGDGQGAVGLYQEAVAIFDGLTKRDPSDAEFAVDMVEIETNLAADLVTLHQTSEALPYATRALESARKLVAGHADNADIKRHELAAEAVAKRISAP